MTEREKLAHKIRALKAKTVENGCTEAEALAAAEMLAKLLAQYNMTLDEAELRESPFARARHRQDDRVGPFLWKVAEGIAYLTGARYWAEKPGEAPEITFFGFSHEVEVARYMLDICSRAMQGELAAIFKAQRLHVYARQRRVARPFLDGMADRLRTRLRAMKPAAPTGKGLVVLHDQLVVQALKDAGMSISDRPQPGSLAAFKDYAAGQAAADRVALNPGLSDSHSQGPLLLRQAKP